MQFIGQDWNEKLPVGQADFYKMKYNFIKFEQELPLTRQIEKYNNLLSKSTFVTSLEAKNKYLADNESVDAKVLYVPFASIVDSTIEVTDSELKSYISKNAANYQNEEAKKNIEYVVFPIKASKEDSSIIKNELINLKQGLITSTNDDASGSEFYTFTPVLNLATASTSGQREARQTVQKATGSKGAIISRAEDQ